MNTLITAPLPALLDRLFADDEASRRGFTHVWRKYQPGSAPP